MTLYRPSDTGTPFETALALAHRTEGELLSGMAAPMFALIITGDAGWRQRGCVRVASSALLLGVLCTVCYEWLSVVVRRTWQYAALMPGLPGLITGLAPLAQWVVLPALANWRAARRFAHLGRAVK